MNKATKEKKRKESLNRLELLAQENWQVFGFNHHHLEKGKAKYFDPQEFRNSVAFKIAKNIISGFSEPKKGRAEGSLQYLPVTQDDSEPTLNQAIIESLYFNIWLVKDNLIAIFSYGKHDFSAETIENVVGRAGFTLTYKTIVSPPPFEILLRGLKGEPILKILLKDAKNADEDNLN